MWSQVAEAFKSNPLVIFELFNEPFLGDSKVTDKDWMCWANGRTTHPPETGCRFHTER